jgi:hypothetical protein
MMTLKQATENVGGLTSASKMPCTGYSIPAKYCKTGGKLREVENSVCSKCYCFGRGNFRFPVVKNALERNFNTLFGPNWVESMAFLINANEYGGYFRMNISGDLQNVKHLENIVAVCLLCPTVKIWCPTREVSIVSEYVENGGKIPENLILRLSATMIDGPTPDSIAKRLGIQVSGVSSTGNYTCPASQQEGRCNSCRLCWTKEQFSVIYKKH